MRESPIGSAPGRLGLVELIGQLGEELVRLVHQEVALAKQELRESLRLTMSGAILIAVGALLALLAVIMLLVLVVELVAAHALAAGVLALVLGGAAAGLLLVGKTRLRVGPPERAFPQTMASLKEDVAWAKQRLKRNGK
jgi:uncharacterized membrane protein YqjE